MIMDKGVLGLTVRKHVNGCVKPEVQRLHVEAILSINGPHISTQHNSWVRKAGYADPVSRP